MSKVLIQRIELSSDTTEIDFVDIPSDYIHLSLIGALRTDNAATDDEVLVALNGNSTDTDYRTQLVDFSGATATTDSSGNIEERWIARCPGASADVGAFANFQAVCSDYATSKRQSLTSEYGFDADGTESVVGIASCTKDDAAIVVDQITLTPNNGTNMASGSVVSLYGEV